MVQSVLWDPESGNEKSKYDGNSESVLELSKLKCPDSIKMIRSRKSNPSLPGAQMSGVPNLSPSRSFTSE